jgi:hypothetical protein
LAYRRERGALAGQEVVVHRLGKQGVAELVESSSRHEHALDSVAHRAVQLGRLQADHRAQRA